MTMFCLLLFLLSSCCLVQNSSDPDTYILGGASAGSLEHGFMVSIFRCSGDGCSGSVMCDSFVCGGTLIHLGWVVTAGHCYTPGLTPSYYQVVVGDYNIVEE